MPVGKRPLRGAAMVGTTGDAIGERDRRGPAPFAPGVRESSGATSVANRVDALAKLNSLLELGVLTQEQHDAELARLTEGDEGRADAHMQLGPVQLLVMPFAKGSFDVTVLAELRRLREHEAIRMLDLLFVAKDETGSIAELQQDDLTVLESAQLGGLVGALFGLGSHGEEGASGDGAAGDEVAAHNGSLRDAADTWFLADTIPVGGAAMIALVEHRWAVPLRDAIQAAGDHDCVDRWLHPDDLLAIGADGF
jgi:uncharacterized membrane protein